MTVERRAEPRAPAPLPLRVAHAGGDYDVHVRAGVLRLLPSLLAGVVDGRRIAAIADDRLSPYLLRWTAGAAPWELLLTVPPGEASKSRVEWMRLTDALLAAGFGRDTALVAIGGGVVGDLTGFVAATFLRGVPYVQVPTTTVAMLDSSVGGKTGVDTAHGKNLVGAFHPPALVVADPLALRTLDVRHYRAGLAEAIKHGLIRDASYFTWIEEQIDALIARRGSAVEPLVLQSVHIKAAVVQADEHERGERAILNAGHTVGHAIEHVSGYTLLHGECVGLGLIAECAIAERLVGLDPAVRQRLTVLLRTLGLPTTLPAWLHDDALLAATRTDKKNRAGVVRCALPRALGAMHEGEGRWTLPVDEGLLREGLAAIR